MRPVPWVMMTTLAGLALASQSAWAAHEFGDDQGSPKLNVTGFSDVNFFAQDEAKPGASHSGFRDGQFVLHFASALAPRVSAFAETTLTTQASGGSSANIERLILRYAVSDALKFTMGRYHTPINWWNEAYHHGLWLQTSIFRPQMIQFGGAFLPVHFLGAMADGVLSVGGLQAEYKLGLGNGRASNRHDTTGGAGDDDNHRALVASLNFRHDRLYRLNVGASAYSDRLNLPGFLADRIEENITAAHLIWTGETPEIISEAASVRHQSVNSGRRWEHTAMYVQLAWRLSWQQGRWKPYLRYESVNLEGGDPFFERDHGGAPLADEEIDLLGIRYDFSAFAAAKLEFRRQRQQNTNVEGIHVQIAFTF